MKHLSLLMIAMILSVACFAQAPGPITGPSSTCLGAATAYSDVTAGGTWSSSDVAIADITMAGVLTGVAAGTVTITYTMPTTLYATYTLTVTAGALPIQGPSYYCVGTTGTLTDSVSGGTWSSSSPAVAMVGSVSGVVTGISPGTAIITYSIGTSCTASYPVTVNSLPPGITGGYALVCVGGTTTFTAPGGGNWSSSVPGVATVGWTSGVVSGAAPGTSTITYSLGTGCSSTVMVTVTTAPVAITGASTLCTGSSITLSDATAGGSWASSNAAVATVSLTVGVVLGVAGGVTTISYSIGSSCYVTHNVTVNPAPLAITGGTSVCLGSGITLGDASAGGIWSSGSTAIASISMASGVVTGMTAGVTAITYALPTGCYATSILTVNPLPAVYTVGGGGSYCTGGTGAHITLSGSAAGNSYQLLLAGATVGSPISGTGSPLDFGLMTSPGVYTIVATAGTTSCAANMSGSATITVSPLPTIYSVTGSGSYCAGGAGLNVLLSGSSSGINYQLYNGTSAVGSPIAGSGGVLDFGAETAAGTYTVVATNASTACSSDMTGSAVITIDPLPTITASASSAGCDGSYALTAGGGTTYTWAPATGLSCTGCGTPAANPSATTSYTVTGADAAGCTNTASVTVDGNRISGTISPAVSGTIRVWLVQFNPSDSSITALDSADACSSGGSQYYDFADPATGNYMVKAYLLGGTPGTSGYIPTYSSSAAHWDAAASVSHATATDNLNITMIYGTVPSGPGFISGYVGAGAGRGTSTTAPVMGMLVYLTDMSNNIITYTYTDASGNYTFNAIANGSYFIYPEAFQYTTSPMTVTLSTSSETINDINFKQHTTTKTITPYDFTAVKPVALNTGITVFPNPASGNLNIQWQNQPIGGADVVVTDVTGREVYKSAININAASGQTQVDLDGVKNGVYVITIKNAAISFSGKLVVQQ